MRLAAGFSHEPPLSRIAPFSPVLSTDGVELLVHQLTDGPATGRPILLAHATGFHGLVWAPLASHLHGFTAFAPDFRGHGDSPAPTTRSMEWAGFADDVLAIVDAMTDSGVATDHLVAAGHSKGGAALLLAEQRRPGTFAALYCYEPVVMPPAAAAAMDGPNPLAEGARRRRDRFASRDEAFANFSGKPPFSALDPSALQAYVDHGFADEPDGTITLKCRPQIESEVYQMGGGHDAFAHLGEIACPVTVATGEATSGAPAAIAALVAEALPRGRLIEFPELGHFGPLEDPARIAASIIETFRSVPGPGTA